MKIFLCVNNYSTIIKRFYYPFLTTILFIILAKKTPSSRSVKGHSPVSRWEMNWLRIRDGRKPS
ncbi:hypothetical protein CO726_30840 [Bacillus fungorum]|uniref:Uncharacterized protein n=1 Tax=Bacillus fungorum TaxID=2039284 RepID=A0A2G6Q5K7_9BACI|nr:hypothetical protein CO726_30840 [Bacillus fungorum]